MKQVRVASGLRYDLAMSDEAVFGKFLRKFVGGQLKVAPEHLAESVLKLMRKPSPELFQKFLALFERGRGEGQFLVPYLISAFPGSTMEDMRRTARWFKQRNWRPRQIQAFIPTPGTVATAMFYGETDGERRLFVARTDRARQAQHGLLTEGLPDPGMAKTKRWRR